MGLFSGKKIHTLGTSVSRVMEDKALPDSLLTAVSRDIFNGDNQLVENFLDVLQTSLGKKAEQMYTYGKNKYLYGAPSATLLDSTEGYEGSVRTLLTTLLGQEPDLTYVHFGPPNLQHMAWVKLIAQYGYDPLKNSLNYTGKTAYLTDFQVHVTPAFAATTAASAVQQWGVSPKQGYTPNRKVIDVTRAHSPIVIDPKATENHATVDVCWRGGKATFTLSLADLDHKQDFYQASYTKSRTYIKVVGDSSEVITELTLRGYWAYQIGLGTYPTLDDCFSPKWAETGQFFPFGYFRYGRKDCLASPTSEEYKASKKLMKYLGIDFVEVAEAIKKNDGIEDVENALLMLAVPAESTDSYDARYLFDFFYALAVRTGGEALIFEADPDNPDTSLYVPTSIHWIAPEYGYVIQDKRSKMAINMDALGVTTKGGSIGEVGTYTSSYVKKYIRDVNGWEEQRGIHTYQYQITEYLYQEVQVVGLAVKYSVSGYYASTVTEDSDSLLIPLDHAITHTYPILFREKLYARSLHYVFHSHIITKLKWYQSSFFQFVMIVVAVVITVISWGADGGSTLASVLAAGSMSAAWAILEPLLIKFLIVTVGVKLFVKLAGEKLAFLAALVAACYGMYQAFEAGGLANAPWAKDLIQIATSVVSEVNSSYSAQGVEIQEDLSDFSAYAAKQYETLEDIRDRLYDTTPGITPYLFLGESPSNYCNRTVHSGNVGTTCFDLVENFADISLRLPEFNTTINNNNFLLG